MNEQPENFDLRSHDVAGDKIAELLRLFPEIRTENGKLDFDRLKLALGQTGTVGSAVRTNVHGVALEKWSAQRTLLRLLTELMV